MEDKKISFNIDSFKVKSFRFEEVDQSLRKDRIAYKLALGLSFVDGNENKFVVRIKSDAEYGVQNPKNLGSIQTETVFNIIRSGKKEKGREFELSDEIVITLLSISYSTTRGALIVKAQSTILADAPMPIINPKETFDHYREEYEKKNQLNE